MNISQKIEAILFWKAEPISITRLAKLLDANVDMVKSGLNELDVSLQERGISLIRTDEDVMLGTAKEYSSIIEKLTKDELDRDIGKAGLETLSIILYQGPISRSEVDYIRGVNSQFVLRLLLIRGLVERVENPKDARSFLYKPTLNLLAHMGLKNIDELPEFKKIREEIERFKVEEHADRSDQ